MGRKISTRVMVSTYIMHMRMRFKRFSNNVNIIWWINHSYQKSHFKQKVLRPKMVCVNSILGVYFVHVVQSRLMVVIHSIEIKYICCTFHFWKLLSVDTPQYLYIDIDNKVHNNNYVYQLFGKLFFFMTNFPFGQGFWYNIILNTWLSVYRYNTKIKNRTPTHKTTKNSKPANSLTIQSVIISFLIINVHFKKRLI